MQTVTQQITFEWLQAVAESPGPIQAVEVDHTRGLIVLVYAVEGSESGDLSLRRITRHEGSSAYQMPALTTADL